MDTKKVITFRADAALALAIRKAARADGRMRSPFLRALVREALAMRLSEINR